MLIATRPVDFRKGADSLAALAKETLAQDPFSGAVLYELAKVGSAPIAEEALRRIAGLYKIEAEIRGRSAVERREVRQPESKPLVAELKTWLEQQLNACLR
jgi:hypothetical protein